MTIRVYLYKNEGRQRAVTLDQLLRNNVKVTVTLREEGKDDHVQERLIESEEDVSLALPGGQWYSIQMVEEFLGSHDEILQAKLQASDKKGFNQEVSNVVYYGALAEVAVEVWNLPYSKSAEGFRAMPAQLAKYIGLLIEEYCYPPLLSSKDFTLPLTPR